MAVFAVVPSGFAVSSWCELERPDVQLVVVVPSCTATAVRLDFNDIGLSAASHQAFALANPDGTGILFTAYSGAGPGISSPFDPPTPWVRIRTAATQTTTVSFSLLPYASSR